jgi:hypothetical protein
MDRQQFINYIHDPRKLDKTSMRDIEELAGEFPYCQSLRILYLLNLRITNHILYNEQLKSAAAHIADRKRLKELIKGLKEDREEKIEGGGAKTDEPEVTVMEQEVKSEPIVPAAVEEIKPEAVVPVVEEDEETRLLALKKIVEDRLKEISGGEEEQLDDMPSEEVQEKDKLSKEEIIEKFIQEEPSISRPKKDFFNPVKVAQSSSEEKDDIVSETLAKIHAQQGNIDKAIEIYHKLSLNFPEKSSYFAAQIKKISTDN